jgi:hypothetical protein
MLLKFITLLASWLVLLKIKIVLKNALMLLKKWKYENSI